MSRSFVAVWVHGITQMIRTSQSQLATEWQQMALMPPDPKGTLHLILIPCPVMRSFRWTEEKIGKVLLSGLTKLPGRYSSTMVNNKWKLWAELPVWRPLLIKCHLKRNLVTNGNSAHAGGYQKGHTSRRMLLISCVSSGQSWNKRQWSLQLHGATASDI